MRRFSSSDLSQRIYLTPNETLQNIPIFQAASLYQAVCLFAKTVKQTGRLSNVFYRSSLLFVKMHMLLLFF